MAPKRRRSSISNKTKDEALAAVRPRTQPVPSDGTAWLRGKVDELEKSVKGAMIQSALILRFRKAMGPSAHIPKELQLEHQFHCQQYLLTKALIENYASKVSSGVLKETNSSGGQINKVEDAEMLPPPVPHAQQPQAQVKEEVHTPASTATKTPQSVPATILPSPKVPLLQQQQQQLNNPTDSPRVLTPVPLSAPLPGSNAQAKMRPKPKPKAGTQMRDASGKLIGDDGGGAVPIEGSPLGIGVGNLPQQQQSQQHLQSSQQLNPNQTGNIQADDSMSLEDTNAFLELLQNQINQTAGSNQQSQPQTTDMSMADSSLQLDLSALLESFNAGGDKNAGDSTQNLFDQTQLLLDQFTEGSNNDHDPKNNTSINNAPSQSQLQQQQQQSGPDEMLDPMSILAQLGGGSGATDTTGGDTAGGGDQPTNNLDLTGGGELDLSLFADIFAAANDDTSTAAAGVVQHSSGEGGEVGADLLGEIPGMADIQVPEGGWDQFFAQFGTGEGSEEFSNLTGGS